MTGNGRTGRTKRISALSALAAFFLLCSPPCAQANETPEGSRAAILVILSYDPTFPTSPDILEALNQSFPPENYELYVHYMNAKRVPGAAQVKLFRNVLANELTVTGMPDLVLTCDDTALHFALDNRSSLFPAVPVVFAGVNDREYARTADRVVGVTGVIEDISPGETVDLMERLFPRMESLGIIVDDTESGQADLKSFIALDLPFPLSIFDVSAVPEKVMMQKLAEHPASSPILLLSAYTGYRGKIYSFWESLALIRRSSRSPLFHLWKHGIGQGILGGKVVSHREQITAAAGMVKRILAGETPGTILVLTDSPNIPIFDWKELKRFHVRIENLPDDAVIINRPESLYQTYPNVFWAMIVAGTAAAGLITALLLLTYYRSVLAGRLTRNLDFLNKLLDSVETPIYLKSIEGRYLMANDCFARLVGHSKEWLIGKDSASIMDGETSAQLENLDRAVLEAHSNRSCDLRFEHSGKRLIFKVSKVPLEDMNGTPLILGSMQDLTAERMLSDQLRTENQRLDTMVAERTNQLKEVNDLLAVMAETDQLTQLANRRKIDSTIICEIDIHHRNGRPLSLIMLDLDFFKLINDQLGHPAGDVVLMAVAAILQKVCRRTDLAGRWGGEEFLIICRDTPLSGAMGLAEKLRAKIEQTEILRNRPVTASFGVCEYAFDDTPASFVQRVDATLYLAKRNGRNRIEKTEPSRP